MSKILNFKALTLLAIVTLLSSLTSCDKEPLEDRPDLPPLESILMDFSAFSDEPAGAKGTEATYDNFIYSYVQVGFWSLAATLYSAIPVAAYGYALQQSPVYQGDYTWEWSFDFMLSNIQYSAILTGKRLNNEEFSMEMVIGLTSAPDNQMKWFDGVVRYDHTHAVWTFYKNGTVPALEIDWTKDFITEEGTLTYTIVEEGNNEEGSYIEYGYMPGEEFDASFDISLAAGMINIGWNTETIKGRVKSLNKYEDDAWHCWDSKANGLADIICE